MRDASLDRLFRRYRTKHDGRALALLFDRTARELLDVACHLVRDPALAEDVVQDTFLAAIRGAARWDSTRPVKAWLYGILWREAAKARRSDARSTEPLRLAERGDLGSAADDRAGDPAETFAARELPEAVERVLERLPARYREVLTPLVRDGRAPDEIARSLGRAPGTVRSQIHRGLERLRRLLPSGLTSLPALAAFPGGGAAPRGLAALRGEVLSAAGFSPALAVAPALVLQVHVATLGGVLVSKTAMVMAAAAVAAALGFWALRGDGGAARGGADPGESRRGAALASAQGEVLEPPAPAQRGAHELETREPASADAPPSGATEPASDPLAYWLARFREAPDDWRHGWSVAQEIAALPPAEALAVMRGVWPHLTLAVKQQALKPFVLGTSHPFALPLLRLAATDASLSVQSRAFHYLGNYAFRDFANDYEAYLAWSARWDDQPLADVLTASARELANDLLLLAPPQLAARLAEVERLELDAGAAAGVDLAAVIRDAGGLQGLATALTLADDKAVRTALDLSKTLGADEGWLRAHVLPVVEGTAGDGVPAYGAYFAALGRPDCAWAEPALLGHLRRIASAPPTGVDPGDDESFAPRGAFEAASALAGIGDPAAIPALIDVLANDRSGELGYAVGYFGLAKLTGVTWHESQDAAWWRDWWEKNRARMPAEVRSAVLDKHD